MVTTLTTPAAPRTTTRDYPTIAAPPPIGRISSPQPGPRMGGVDVAAPGEARPAPETRLAHETTARAYGERAARLVEWLPLGWDVVSSSLAAGWAGAHEASCGCAQDWRLSLPLVKVGWLAARTSHFQE